MGNETYNVGDCVFLQPPTKVSSSISKLEFHKDCMWAARIISIWTENGELWFEGSQRMQMQCMLIFLCRILVLQMGELGTANRRRTST